MKVHVRSLRMNKGIYAEKKPTTISKLDCSQYQNLETKINTTKSPFKTYSVIKNFQKVNQICFLFENKEMLFYERYEPPHSPSYIAISDKPLLYFNSLSLKIFPACQSTEKKQTCITNIH